METKDRYFYLEYFLTFLLFLPLLFLFPKEVAPLRIFLAGDIILGAGVAYISRNKFYSFRKFATLVVSILILGGTVYFVLKSTFLYEEVIVICIKSLSLLIVINSFSSCLQGYLNSMQIYSILLFFCICAFTKGYSNFFLILVSGFAFNLLAVTRIKFYTIFNPSVKSRTRQQGINVLFIIVLALAALLAWVLFMNLPLGRIKVWRYFKEESLSLMEGREKEKDISLPEEQIQKELTELTLKLSSTDEMHKVIVAIQDLLIKEKPFACEVDKAKKDVLGMVSNPILAQGAMKTKELNDSIRDYVDNKILKNLNQLRSEINKVIENNHIGLQQRFAILSLVNKIEYSNSSEEIDKYNEQLRMVLNDAPIADDARKQLKQLDKQLKEWKTYKVYTRKFDSFQGKIDAMDENKKQGFKELAKQIGDASTISESTLVDKLIESMRQVALLEDDKLIDEAAQLLKLKRIMLASKESSQLRKQLEDSGQAVDRPPELEDALNAVEESRDAQEIVKKISKLVERMREENYLQVSREAKAILAAKLENLIKESVDALKKQIQESNLPDSGESLLESLKAMDSGNTKEEITAASAQMQESLEKFYKQGSITKEAKDNLIKETKKVEQLFIVRLGLTNMGKQEESSDKNKSLDYKEKVAKLLQNISLNNEQKERINKLMDKLAAAKTVAQVENALEALNQEIDALTRKENTKDIEKIKELMQEAAAQKKMFVIEKDSYNLREKIEDLKNVLPQQAALLENNLDKIRESKTKQDLFKSVSRLKELSESKQFENKFKVDESLEVSENKEQQERLKIDLLPSYAILPIKSSVSLKSVTIYDNFVKDITPELEWFSSNPSVAFVNQFGVVYARAIGEAKITARYRGIVSRKCKVTVVEMIPESETVFIKNELRI